MVTKEVTNLNIYYYFNMLAILDADFCFGNSNPCPVNAQCVNPLGTYEQYCVCNPGFYGNNPGFNGNGNLCQCKFFCRVTNMLQKLNPIT